MKHRMARPVEFTPAEREREHEKLQGFINSYLKYPISVMADVPDPTERLVSQAIALDGSEQSS